MAVFSSIVFISVDIMTIIDVLQKERKKLNKQTLTKEDIIKIAKQYISLGQEVFDGINNYIIIGYTDYYVVLINKIDWMNKNFNSCVCIEEGYMDLFEHQYGQEKVMSDFTVKDLMKLKMVRPDLSDITAKMCTNDVLFVLGYFL